MRNVWASALKIRGVDLIKRMAHLNINANECATNAVNVFRETEIIQQWEAADNDFMEDLEGGYTTHYSRAKEWKAARRVDKLKLCSRY